MMDDDIQYCVNCANCKRTYPGFLLLIPIIGWIWMFIKHIEDGTSVFNRYCIKSGRINYVTGVRGKLSFCRSARSSQNRCADFISTSTPLKNAPDRWLMDEIRSRGLLNTMKNYKKSGDV